MRAGQSVYSVAGGPVRLLRFCERCPSRSDVRPLCVQVPCASSSIVRPGYVESRASSSSYVEGFQIPSITSASRGAGSGSGPAAWVLWIPPTIFPKKKNDILPSPGRARAVFRRGTTQKYTKTLMSLFSTGARQGGLSKTYITKNTKTTTNDVFVFGRACQGGLWKRYSTKQK